MRLMKVLEIMNKCETMKTDLEMLQYSWLTFFFVMGVFQPYYWCQPAICELVLPRVELALHRVYCALSAC